MTDQGTGASGEARTEPPWLVRGDAFIVVTVSSTELNFADAHIPSLLRGIYHNLFNVMVLVDYRDTPVGPFRELLYIPGRFRFGDDERMTVTCSYINSDAGRLIGRAYGTGSSQLASISRVTTDTSVDQFSIGERPFASFSFQAFGPDLPLNGKVIPEAYRTFANLDGDRTAFFTLGITGTMRAARFATGEFDASMFPDMAKRESVLAIKISDALVEFPRPNTGTWATA